MRYTPPAWLLLALCLFPRLASAASIDVTCAWARASLPYQPNTVAYMILASPVDDTLTGVESDQAEMVMLHQTISRFGISDMQDIDSLAVPAGKKTILAPGHAHMMIMNLKHPLKPGDNLPLRLHFAHAGDVSVTARVMPVMSSGPCP